MVKRIRELCNEKGISLSALGKELGLGKNAIARWDTNKPSIEKVEKVADYFDVSVDYLLGRTDIPEDPAKALVWREGGSFSAATKDEQKIIEAFLAGYKAQQEDQKKALEAFLEDSETTK